MSGHRDNAATVLVKGGRVVTETDDFFADVLVADGRIQAIGADLDPDGATRVIDARERYVLPGCVDPHTHMDMPFGATFTCDDFTSGTVAAAFGGTTCHVDFCMQPHGATFREALDIWFGKLEAAPPVVDVGFHIAVTDLSDPGRIEELRTLPDLGVTSFKLFMAYKGSFQVDDATLFQVMEVAVDTGSLVMVHGENGDVIDLLIKRALAAGNTSPAWHGRTRPLELEVEATARAIQLAKLSGANLYVVHVSNGETAALIEAARREGLPVWGETCTQYLTVDETDLEQDGWDAAKYVFSPPPRAKHQQEALWKALESRALSVIATDHAPFRLADQKALGRDDFSLIPNGAPGIEERLSVIHELGVRSGRISLNEMVGLLATHPAKLFGLYPRKGTLAVGADADIVVFDPAHERTLSVDNLHSAVDYTLFEGMKVTGAPETVLVRGQVIVSEGELEAEPGAGGFVKRGKPLTGVR
jgi:dihydropyrimidinase